MYYSGLWRQGATKRTVDSVLWGSADHYAMEETWRDRARRLMRERRLTQEALAEKLGMTQGGLQHWLAGTRQPTLDQLNEIAHQLGVPAAHLICGLDADDIASDLPVVARETLRTIIHGAREGRLSPEWFDRLQAVLNLVAITPPLQAAEQAPAYSPQASSKPPAAVRS